MAANGPSAGDVNHAVVAVLVLSHRNSQLEASLIINTRLGINEIQIVERGRLDPLRRDQVLDRNPTIYRKEVAGKLARFMAKETGQRRRRLGPALKLARVRRRGQLFRDVAGHHMLQTIKYLPPSPPKVDLRLLPEIRIESQPIRPN
eukprot:3028682-Heterocapsa_arctica.AAC.1